MNAFGSWALAAVLLAGMAAPSFAQQKPLNATVVVREHPSSIVPTECEQGLAAAAPRAAQPVAEPATLPETSSMIANQDVAQALRRVQAFAEANDHDGFVEALAEARTAADAAPPGGQRDAARDALRVESDIDRLWTFAVTSPTGAFFDASSEEGALLTMLRQYPDYGRSIVDSTLVVGGQTLYPTRESRQFLIRQAASRLVRLGIHSAPRVPRAPAVARNQTAPEAPAPVSPLATATTGTTATTATPRPASRSAATTSATVPVTRAGRRKANQPVAPDGDKHSPTRSTRSQSSKRASTSARKHPGAAGTNASVRTTGTSSTAGDAVRSRQTKAAVATAPVPKPTVTKTSSASTSAPAPPAVTATRSANPVVTATPSPAAARSASSTGSNTMTAAATNTTTSGSGLPAATPLNSSVPVTASAATSTATSGDRSATAAPSASPPVIATTSTTTATTDPAAAPTVTTETVRSTTTAETAGERGGKLNLMFAVILIVAGIGLLVVFLRASD